jgi:hypothetical protein
MVLIKLCIQQKEMIGLKPIIQILILFKKLQSLTIVLLIKTTIHIYLTILFFFPYTVANQNDWIHLTIYPFLRDKIIVNLVILSFHNGSDV